MDIALFYLPDVKYGGWPTYTAHLYYGLLEAGHNPQLFRISKKSEKTNRNWGRGITYRNVNLYDAFDIASTNLSIITATTKDYDVETEALVKVGAKVIIHDPTELKGNIPAILAECKDVITIRPVNVGNLAKLGVESRYVPHPYARNPQPRSKKLLWAVSFSRVDWDKGTHFIVEANDNLSLSKRITIYGAANRMYAHHKLPIHWEEYYRGTFPADNLWAGAQIASRYQWAVDMSTISGDGGGTQYTFLEAADSGTALMLNEGWLTDRDDDELKGYATFVNPEHLAEEITKKPTIYADALLEHHDARKLAIKTIGIE